MDKSNCEVFYADVKPITYVSLICMLIILIVAPVGILNSLNIEPIAPGLILILAPLFIVFLSLATLIIIAIFAIPRMRYELHEAELLIVLGPRKERIPYNHIVDILAKDLSFNVLSSFRMPGVALFDVMYSDEGIVRMYSTHALKDVVLIKTLKKKYGISPKDKEGFISSLGKHLSIEIENVSRQAEISTAERKSAKNIAESLVWSIVIASFIICIVFYPRLPQIIAIHWDIQFNPNGYAGKFWGLFGPQLIFSSIALIPLFSKGKDREYTYEVLLPVVAILPIMQIYLILKNLGFAVNDKLIFAACMILALLTVLLAFLKVPKMKK